MIEIMKKINVLKSYKMPLLAVFSFLMGCMLAVNLVSIDKTCKIKNTDKEYSMLRNSELDNPELIIIIFSAPKNLQKRNTIRQTWLKLKDKTTTEKVKFKMKHYFAIGNLGLTVDEILHLSTEQSEFSDILILPMFDSYFNLTEKVVKSFEWLTEQVDYGLGFKYVLKCDDDSFVRLDELAGELINLESTYLRKSANQLQNLSKNVALQSQFIRINAQNNQPSGILQLYWGYFNGNSKVKSRGKWKENDWIICDKYAPYALGGGYVLSKNLVSFIAKNADNLRYFNSEDVSVGLWLSPVNNILRIHDIRFDTEWTSRGCQNFHFITHNISVKEMLKMYENILKTNNICTVENLKRNYYFYNWLNPPSQCCSN